MKRTSSIMPKWGYRSFCAIALILGLILGISSPGQAEVSFSPRVDIGIGGRPTAVVVCDLNGDGKLDLAIANGDAGTISVFLGDGTGVFTQMDSFYVGGWPNSIAFGDLNGDGKLDLAVTNSGSNTVSVLPGDGSGGFGSRVDFPTGISPYSIAIGDLNSDAKLDLAMTNSMYGTLSLYLGDGLGGFGQYSEPGIGGIGAMPHDIAVGDLNGDGKLDLAIANYMSHTILVLPGDGTGNYGLQIPVNMDYLPFSLAIADFNRDGKPDLVVTNSHGNTVSVLWGDGTGAFGTKSDFFVGASPFFVAVADFNADGNPDLVVTRSDANSNSISVILGDGAGSFAPLTEYVAGDTPWRIAVGDLNRDGKPDIVVANFNANSLSLFLNSTTLPPSGLAYITNQTSGTASILDTATTTVMATVAVGQSPHGVAVHPAGTRVYIANTGNNTISVLDTATNTVIATVAVGNLPHGVAVHPAGTRVYIANTGNNTISVLDTATNTVIATVAVGNLPHGVSVHPNGTSVYVSHARIGYSDVSVLDTNTNTIRTMVGVQGYPLGITVHPAGTRVYVANSGSNTVSVLDTTTNEVTATVAVGQNPHGISVHPSGSRVYVANSGSNTVSVLDTTTNEVTATVAVGQNPHGISVHPSGSRVYVANSGGNTVSIIETVTNTVTGTVAVGSNPVSFGQFIGPEVPASTFPITTAKNGAGSGILISNPVGIDCGAICSATFVGGTSVTLTATPDSGFAFAGWSGACSGTGTCTVFMNAAKDVTATFTPGYTLTVSTSGQGSGTVNSTPDPGIVCNNPGTCMAQYAPGATTTLWGNAATGSYFAGWGGDCAFAGTNKSCTLTMNNARSVSAQFNVNGDTNFTLSVAVNGNGTVTATGINCSGGGDCSDSYSSGTSVTLTAQADAGSTFTGWSGACMGTGPCSVTMNSEKTVTGTFSRLYTLTVTRFGAGSGTVTSSPGGINCGGDCSESYASGMVVTLTANPDLGSTFAGWSGDPGCTDGSLTMSGPRSCMATFNPTGGGGTTYPLTVTVSGAGSVTSDGAYLGINCPGDCSESFSSGSTVTLTATPTAPAVFAGWGGACTTQGTPGTTCTVTMNVAKTVTAAFVSPATAPPNLSVYDVFDYPQPDPKLDPTRWGTPGATRDFVREIRGGELFMAVGASVLAGQRSGINLNRVNPNPPTPLQGLSAKVSLTAATPPPPDGQSRVVLTGAFYSASSEGSGAKNDVRAQIGVRVLASGTQEVFYSVFQCNDANCSTSTDLVLPTHLIDATLGQSYTVGIAWSGSQFTFTVGDTHATYTPVTVGGGPRVPMVSLNANVRAGSSGDSGYVAGTFDDVTVNGILFDDFNGTPYSGPWIDRTKWNPGETVLEVRNGQLAVQAYAVGGTGTPQNTLGVANPGAVTALAVDVMVQAPTAPNLPGPGMAGLQGRFYSTQETLTSGDGDVNAEVAYAPVPDGTLTLTLSFQVYHTLSTGPRVGLAFHPFATGLPRGEFHRLFLVWDPTAQVFTYGYYEDGETAQTWMFDPKPFAPVGNLSPFAPFKGIVAGAFAPAGSSTELKAVFDNVAVNASANPNPVLTTVIAGAGSVSDDQTGGIDGCTLNCSATYAPDTVVTLTATPDAGSYFAGWSGACSGTDPCTVTMDAAKTVTATFTTLYTLTVTKTGTGSGTVTSSPTGITCPTDCTEAYASGTVTLSAEASAGSTFIGWAGEGCNGITPCTVTMDGARTVTATFVPLEADLVIAQSVNPDPGIVGSNLTYGLTVTNVGPAPASGVALTHSITGNATFVSATPTGNCSGTNPVTCSFSLGTLNPSASTNVTIVVTTTTVGSLTSTANVTATEPDAYPANNAITTLTNVVNTPTGTNVPVQPQDTTTGTAPATLTFPSVSTPGVTSLTTTTSAPELPSGFQLVGPAASYDITTTAIFSGWVTVCISNSGVTSTSQLFHFESGTWVDRTVSVDNVNHVICASVESLSPFVILEPVPPPDTTLTATPPALTNSTNASFSFAATKPNSTFECQLDGGVFSTCTSPKIYSGLNDGGHAFQVRAVLAGTGDPTPANYAWTVHTTPPTITFVNHIPDNGWNNTAVTVNWTCADNVGVMDASVSKTLSSDGANQSATGTCTDTAGNTASDTHTDINIDMTKPTLNPSVSPNRVLLGGSATVTSYAADSLSGLATQGCGTLDTSSVGSKSVTCTATDKAGNTNSASVTYNVIYNFTGFFSPVSNPPILNTVNAGSSATIKFSLGSNQGLSILADGFPVSRRIDCKKLTPTGGDLATVPSGSSGLHYDPVNNQYGYAWKTDSTWKGSCRRIEIQLFDGSKHLANFQFK